MPNIKEYKPPKFPDLPVNEEKMNIGDQKGQKLLHLDHTIYNTYDEPVLRDRLLLEDDEVDRQPYEVMKSLEKSIRRGDKFVEAIDNFLIKARGVPKGVDKDKWERCVLKVKAKGTAQNPWAVCNAALQKGYISSDMKLSEMVKGVEVYMMVGGK